MKSKFSVPESVHKLKNPKLNGNYLQSYQKRKIFLFGPFKMDVIGNPISNQVLLIRMRENSCM